MKRMKLNASKTLQSENLLALNDTKHLGGTWRAQYFLRWCCKFEKPWTRPFSQSMKSATHTTEHRSPQMCHLLPFTRKFSVSLFHNPPLLSGSSLRNMLAVWGGVINPDFSSPTYSCLVMFAVDAAAWCCSKRHKRNWGDCVTVMLCWWR